ncbi:MAG TPA: AgmX/PglI C-terminal domain-containing protein, partial [Myxococcaceae bacterium]|nr:AgmX/PglI C-terminal domain-containing protein [Myxococcaceae bacterium]
RLLVAGGVAVVLGLLGLGAWQVARHAAVYLPDDAPTIHVEPPKISFARPSVPEELLEYPGEPKRTPSRSVSRPTATQPDKVDDSAKPENTGKSGIKDESVALASASPVSGSTSRRTGGSGGRSRKGSVSSEPDGLQMMTTFDQAAINRVVKKHQPSLFRCFKEEAQRSPGFSARIPLEFTIGNDGRVAKLWVDHPRFKKGPLHDCLFGELRKWPFKPYEGERATVNLAFTIGKKG